MLRSQRPHENCWPPNQMVIRVNTVHWLAVYDILLKQIMIQSLQRNGREVVNVRKMYSDFFY